MSPTSAPEPQARRQDLLNTQERLVLLDVIDALEFVSTANQLVACTDGVLQRILPHERFACALTYITDCTVRPYRLLLNRFPRGYIDEILCHESGGFNSPMVMRWRETQLPVLMDPEVDPSPWSPRWIEALADWGIRNCASHGLVDVQGVIASYFSFVNIPEPLGEKHAYLLRRLLPHLHVALVRSLATVESIQYGATTSAPAITLSRRQKEVLDWLRLGKTNWEIAKILGTSEDNIKYHVSRIFARLNAANRTQAVAKALLLNSIEP